MNASKRDLQLKLEALYDKNQLMPRVRKAFKDCEEVDFAAHMKEAEIPEKFGFDLLAQMAIHKRATVPTMIGCLRHHFSSDQETADMLERATHYNFVEYSTKSKEFIVIFEISAELQEELDRFQYPLPMVIRPLKINSNLETGYLTSRGSVILRDNHHDNDVCLDHLNRLNQTKFSINLDVAQTIQNKWKGLDKKRPNENWEDFQRRKKAFQKYDSVAKDVIGLLLKEGNELYLTHRYDKRGRTYCMGYHINYQGNPWNKAILELAEKETLND